MSDKTFEPTTLANTEEVWSPSEVAEFFEQNGFLLTAKQAEQFCVYGKFLQEQNKIVNLTAIVDKRGILQKHFLDSALIAQFVPQNATLCDVGCGAGFPSVVVKILRPDVSVTAVDSVGKKTVFVTQLLQKLGVDGQVKNLRAEDLAKQNRETYDVVCARAVAELPTLLEYLAPLTRVGGVVVAQKSKESQQEQAKALFATQVLGLQKAEQSEFSLPNGDVRVVLRFKKIAPTPKKYPRGQNAPRKNPLIGASRD